MGPLPLGRELWKKKGSLILEISFTTWEVWWDREGASETQGENVGGGLCPSRAQRDQHRLPLHVSKLPTCLNIHECEVGKFWISKLQWTVWRKDSVWLYRDSLKGLEYSLGHDWECVQNDVGVHRKSPIVNTQNKGHRCTIAVFLSACSQQSMVSTTKGFANFQGTQTWRWGSWNLSWLSTLPNQAQEYNFGRTQTSEFWDQNNAFKPKGHLS